MLCKVHPYMTGVVAVVDEDGNIPDVTPDSLPFIGHLTDALGLPSGTTLPATTVLSVLTTVAPLDGNEGLFGKISDTPLFPAGHPLVGANGAFGKKWDILTAADEIIPTTPGVGEVWIDTQFERVPGQTDDKDVLKPGTITVVDAATFAVEREINGLGAEDNMWNNPHNMWANDALDTIYNSNWFGKWINKINRASGNIQHSIKVGEAPTHIITVPQSLGMDAGVLTIPLSAEKDIVKVEERADGELHIIDHFVSGTVGGNHPHGHWLNCGNGDRIVSPNVFSGLGVAGTISVIDTKSGMVLREFTTADDPNLLMPLAAGECHVHIEGVGEINKAYVSNVVTGVLTVINVGGDGSAPGFEDASIITDIPVTLKPNGDVGGTIFDTLQVPIQTPVSPDGRFVATAVLSLTTVPRALPGGGSSADHVAIIDARTDTVVKWLAAPAGAHGINWGAKLGGGYYAYVASQHANVLTVIDPDPNGDANGSDAAVVGTIVLANGSTGAGVTDGTGGQGIKPLPVVHDGWVQSTVALAEAGEVSPEVAGWVDRLTEEQKNPEAE